MTGFPLIIVFIISIVAMVLMISKLKIHPFISIMTISLIFGLIAGIPLVNQTDADGNVTLGLANVIGQGFSGIFTSIGIVIILGALIGSILEATGAALKLADIMIHLVGKSNPVLAVELMGWVVSIPVFCDSGFVILNPIRKAMAKRTGESSVAMTVGLAAGLHLSHVFIPPTPGPIAAASTLGIGDNLLMVMGIGAVCSIAPLIGAMFFAKWIGKQITSDDESDLNAAKSYEELVNEFGELPGGFISLAPIIVPVILMALASIFSMLKVTGGFADVIAFLGTPIIALTVGTIFAIVQLKGAGKMGEFYNITNETLKTVGPILFVTGAGAVLGKVISSSDMVHYITEHATVLASLGILFPYLLSTILKTAQGSGTVALTTTAGIVAPLLPVLGLDSPIRTALCCAAIGAGAMTVSHSNDSFFWVVTNFGGLTVEKGLKTQTLGSLITGLLGFASVFVLSLFLH